MRTIVRSRMLPAVTLLLFAGGCVHRTINEFQAALEEQVSEPPADPVEMRELVVANDDRSDPAASTASAGASASLRHQPHEPTLFRLGAGYGALGQVDLAPCRNQGLPPGYLRMRVTFQRNGRVARAAVETAVAPTNEALNCVGEQLEAAMVPVFDGVDVTLSKSVFVN